MNVRSLFEIEEFPHTFCIRSMTGDLLAYINLRSWIYRDGIGFNYDQDQIDELLVKMWNTFQVKKETLSQEESEAILNFIKHCLSFIDNCIHFNIINVTEHPPQPCVLEPLPETSLVLPSLQTHQNNKTAFLHPHQKHLHH